MKVLLSTAFTSIFALTAIGCADNSDLKHPQTPVSELETNYTTHKIEIGDLEKSLQEVENIPAHFCAVSRYRQAFSFSVETVGQCNNIAQGLSPNGGISAHSFNDKGEIIVSFIKDMRSNFDTRISIKKHTPS